MYDPKNVNSRLKMLEDAIFGFHRPVYVDGVQPSEKNTHPAILQTDTIIDGKQTKVDVLEYVPGIKDDVSALLAYQKGFIPAGEGAAVMAGLIANGDLVADEETPAPKKRKR